MASMWRKPSNIKDNLQREAYLCNASNGNSIWIQFPDADEALNEIGNHLLGCKNLPYLKNLSLGEPCLAVFTEDEQLYRGRIDDIRPNDAKVTFVDYGNSEYKRKDMVFAPPPHLFNIPAQGVECCLEEFIPDVVNAKLRTELKFYTDNERPITVLFMSLNANGVYVIKILDGDTCITDPYVQDARKINMCPVYSTSSLPGRPCGVVVSHIESPADFYVRLEGNLVQIVDLEGSLQMSRNLEPLPKDSRIGTACVCRYTKDSKFRRAEVASKPVGGNLKVRFVDWGFTEMRVMSELFKLNSSDLNVLPAQAIRCCLKLVDTDTMKYKPTDREVLLSITGEGSNAATLTCKRVDSLPDGRSVVTLTVNGMDVYEKYNEKLFSREQKQQAMTQYGIGSNVVVPEPDLQIGINEKVYITDFISPTNLFAQFEKYPTDELEQFTQRMTQFYTKLMKDELNVYGDGKQHDGEFCASKYIDDYYRARIVNVNERPSFARVVYVDYGNTEFVHTLDLKRLTDKFTVPVFGIHLSMVDPPENSEKLKDVLLNNSFSISIKRKLEPFKYEVAFNTRKGDQLENLLYKNIVSSSQSSQSAYNAPSQSSYQAPAQSSYQAPAQSSYQQSSYKSPPRSTYQPMASSTYQPRPASPKAPQQYNVVPASSAAGWDEPSAPAPSLTSYYGGGGGGFGGGGGSFTKTNYTNPRLRSTEEVFVSHVENCCLFCRIDRLAKEFEPYEAELQEFCKGKGAEVLAEPFARYAACLAYDAEKGMYMRGKVMSRDGDEPPTRVRFVDYGHVGNVDNDRIFVVPQQFFKVPMVAAECKIEGIDSTERLLRGQKSALKDLFINKNMLVKCIETARRPYVIELTVNDMEKLEEARKIVSDKDYTPAPTRDDRSNRGGAGPFTSYNSRNGLNGEGDANGDWRKKDTDNSSTGQYPWSSGTKPVASSTQVETRPLTNGYAMAPASSSQATDRLIDEDIVVGSTHKVEFAYVERDTKLMFAQLVAKKESFAQMMERLQTVYEGLKAWELNPEGKFTVGMACCAQFSDDMGWYRAKILKVLNANEVSVSFIDYGNVEASKSTQIRTLKSDFMTLPAQAIKCSVPNLDDFQPDTAYDIDFLDKQGDAFIIRIHVPGAPFPTPTAQLQNGVVSFTSHNVISTTVQNPQPQYQQQQQPNYQQQMPQVIIQQVMAPPAPQPQKAEPKPEPPKPKRVANTIALKYDDIIECGLYKSLDISFWTEGDFQDVTVGWVDSKEGILACRLRCWEESLNEISDKMQEKYSCDNTSDKLVNPKSGDPCTVFREDRWVRAVVMKRTSPSVIEVACVDYGSVESYRVAKTKKLSADFYTELPATIFYSKLQETPKCQEPGVEFSLTDLLAEIGVDFSACEIVAKLDRYDKASGFYYATLYDTTDEGETDLNAAITELYEGKVKAYKEKLAIEAEIARREREEQQRLAREKAEQDAKEAREKAEQQAKEAREKAEREAEEARLLRIENLAKFQCVLPLDETVAVYVSCIESANEFFVQLSGHEGEFEEMMESIQTEVPEIEGTLPADQIRFGTICLAQYSEDLRYWRSEILSATKNDARIRFVDYGNTEVVKKELLKPITAEMLAKKSHCVRCRIYGIAGDFKSDQFYTDFETLAGVTDGVEVKIRMFQLVEENGYLINNVRLYNEGVDIVDSLVEKGHVTVTIEVPVVDKADESQLTECLEPADEVPEVKSPETKSLEMSPIHSAASDEQFASAVDTDETISGGTPEIPCGGKGSKESHPISALAEGAADLIGSPLGFNLMSEVNSSLDGSLDREAQRRTFESLLPICGDVFEREEEPVLDESEESANFEKVMMDEVNERGFAQAPASAADNESDEIAQPGEKVSIQNPLPNVSTLESVGEVAPRPTEVPVPDSSEHLKLTTPVRAKDNHKILNIPEVIVSPAEEEAPTFDITHSTPFTDSHPEKHQCDVSAILQTRGGSTSQDERAVPGLSSSYLGANKSFENASGCCSDLDKAFLGSSDDAATSAQSEADSSAEAAREIVSGIIDKAQKSEQEELDEINALVLGVTKEYEMGAKAMLEAGDVAVVKEQATKLEIVVVDEERSNTVKVEDVAVGDAAESRNADVVPVESS